MVKHGRRKGKSESTTEKHSKKENRRKEKGITEQHGRKEGSRKEERKR